MAENRTIGINNRLPWRLPADLKRFRYLTCGHHVLMGRKTCESLDKPLPQRINIVLTSNPSYARAGFVTANGLGAALEIAKDDAELFAIGGASVYEQLLPNAQRIYLTLVHAQVQGDTWFPRLRWSDWQELARERHAADAKHRYAFSFLTLQRIRES